MFRPLLPLCGYCEDDRTGVRLTDALCLTPFFAEEPKMSRQLTLDLPDEIFQPLAQAAQRAGQSLEQWATVQLRSCAASSTKQAADLSRLMVHAGAVDLGRPTGANNESIDVDLAREYGSSHEGER